MDLLSSGRERTRAELVGRAWGWHPSRRAVTLLAGLVVTTLAGAVVALPVTRGLAQRAADRVELEVSGESAVAVRGRGRDGTLVLTARNAGEHAVSVRGAELDVPGARGRAAVVGLALSPGQSARVTVPFSVRDCDALERSGRLRLRVAPEGRPERWLPLEVGPDGALSDDLFAAGCRPVSSPDAVVVSLRATGGQVGRTSAGIAGRYEVEVRNEGSELRHVRVHGEVPGVTFSTAAFIGVPAGARLQARLPFAVPACEDLRRTGRIVVTVLRDGEPYLELGFRATEDEEAGTVRDVDLDLVLGACARPQPPG
jgi:hypothetical protein